MNRQLNCFAAPEDAAGFHSWLLTTFPDMAVVYDDSAAHQTGRVPQPLRAALLGLETVYLIPEWAKDRLVYSPPGSMVALDLFDSPVLTYSPSVIQTDKECIEAGRIYWGFRGHIERLEKKQIATIFRWVESHSEVVPGWGGWRMFPHAKRIPFVRQSVTDPKPNPLFSALPL